MSYYANQLREHGRNYFDEDAANELDRLEDELTAANQQIAVQALTIKTMREALEKFIDSHEECTDFDGFTAQIVSIDDYHEAQEAISIPDNSTKVLQEWFDSKPGNKNG